MADTQARAEQRRMALERGRKVIAKRARERAKAYKRRVATMRQHFLDRAAVHGWFEGSRACALCAVHGGGHRAGEVQVDVSLQEMWEVVPQRRLKLAMTKAVRVAMFACGVDDPKRIPKVVQAAFDKPGR